MLSKPAQKGGSFPLGISRQVALHSFHINDKFSKLVHQILAEHDLYVSSHPDYSCGLSTEPGSSPTWMYT